KALLWYDKGSPKSYQFLKSDHLDFEDYEATNAFMYISCMAKNFQVVMINEAHHSSLHRNFTKLLLKNLYESGFRYLGLEALNSSDSINDRKYPVQSSGFYTNEPEFGILLREALNLGYQVFGYESVTRGNPKQREIEQAENIKKILDNDQNAKILIHAGFGHIRENKNIDKIEKAMAGRFREITGIDPLTIDQASMSERSKEVFENPFYRVA